MASRSQRAYNAGFASWASRDASERSPDPEPLNLEIWKNRPAARIASNSSGSCAPPASGKATCDAESVTENRAAAVGGATVIVSFLTMASAAPPCGAARLSRPSCSNGPLNALSMNGIASADSIEPSPICIMRRRCAAEATMPTLPQ